MKKNMILIFTLLIGLSGYVYAQDYDSDFNNVKVYIQSNEFLKAEDALKTMNENYPDNLDVLSSLARVLFWQKKYDESIEVYQKILKIKEDDSVKEEMEKVVIAKTLLQADLLLKDNKENEAEILLKDLFDSGKEQYESGYKLGLMYIRRREYDKALDMFTELKTLFPKDVDMAGFYIDCFILKRDTETAKKNLSSLPDDIKEALSKNRPDIFYKLTKNSAKLSGGTYVFKYSDNTQYEVNAGLGLVQKINPLTLDINAYNISRYGLNDTQINVDAYSKIWDTMWGFVSLSISPDAEFLPQSVFGGEVYYGYKWLEGSLGYRRMNFKDASVDIIMPGIIFYLPYEFSLTEKAYILLNNTYSLSSTLNYALNYQFSAYYSFVWGQSAETIRTIEDIQIPVISNTLGGEYRITPNFSISGEVVYESRQEQYDRYGFMLFGKYWWY